MICDKAEASESTCIETLQVPAVNSTKRFVLSLWLILNLGLVVRVSITAQYTLKVFASRITVATSVDPECIDLIFRAIVINCADATEEKITEHRMTRTSE